jgi:hypothetical protein
VKECSHPARAFSEMSSSQVNPMQHDAEGTPRPPLKTIDELLEYWRVRIMTVMDAHLLATDSLSWRNFWLGGTATILAAIVSSSIFATLQDSVATGIRVVVGCVSLLSASLIGLKTYLKYGERVEAHRRASHKYGALVHWITELQATPPPEPELRERRQDPPHARPNKYGGPESLQSHLEADGRRCGARGSWQGAGRFSGTRRRVFSAPSVNATTTRISASLPHA